MYITLKCLLRREIEVKITSRLFTNKHTASRDRSSTSLPLHTRTAVPGSLRYSVLLLTPFTCIHAGKKKANHQWSA